MQNGRRLYRSLLVCALAAAPTLLAGCKDPSPPDIFLITSDALRPDHLALNGYVRETSPHLDRFAASATNYTQAVTPIPKTGASLTSMLSGLPPLEHGVEANRFTIPPEIPLLSERLSAAGYQTGAFLGNPVLDGASGYSRGFDRFALYGKGDPVAMVNGAFLAWTREVDWSRPVFAWVHYIDPHGPYTPPPALLRAFASDATARADTRRVPLDYRPIPGWPIDYVIGAIPRYQRIGDEDRAAAYVARYDAEIRYMDEAFGTLLAELERRGVLARSVVLFASDHGESLGEGDYWFEHGWYVDDGELRIALLLKTPGQRRGSRSSAPASILDVAPTLLALAGLPPDPHAPGRDLRTPPPPDPQPLVIANASTYPSRYMGLRGPDWKYVRRTQKAQAESIPESWPAEALYDLRADPSEQHNLAMQQPQRVEALRHELDVRVAAETGTHRPGLATPSEETKRQLRALGYSE